MAAGMAYEHALVAEDLVKVYGKKRALDSLQLKIPKGSIFGLIGANGAGKTTLMSIACGLVKPTDGAINLLGEGDFDVEKHTGRITILPQDSGLPGYTKVESILRYYARLQGLSSKEARISAQEKLEWVNLADRRRDLIHSLSHGMLRRLTVAQAFLGEPELIFLDEPMSGLDPKEVYNMRQLIRSRAGKQTIVLSSHLLAELEQACDQIAFVQNGRLIRQGPIDEMLNSKQTMRYRLRGDIAPSLDDLTQKLSDFELSWDPGKRLLTANTKEEELRPSEINAIILPVLLGSNCPIDEVLLGTDLEQEFLRSQS